MSKAGELASALALAARAVHEHPSHPQRRLAWGFLLLTCDPTDAELRLRESAWLWDPQALRSGSPELAFVSVQEWASSLLDLI